MNEKRRKRLQTAIDHLESARDIVDECAQDEQQAFDSLPEVFQFTERGDKMQEAVSVMEEAVGLIDEAVTLVEQASE